MVSGVDTIKKGGVVHKRRARKYYHKVDVVKL